MADGQNRVFRHLRELVERAGDACRTDRELLDQFAAARDERAFAALVRRHGRLVMSVCRRVLANEHDAEDAFQAVFLVLAKKASTVAWQSSVSSWLHQVASRVALKIRGRRARQEQRRTASAREPAAESLAEMTLGELRLALDEELQRLPERFRIPLQLCCLEGRTQDEAAQVLGWTAGTVRGRLNRGRELLRKRLARRGLSISATLLASALAQTTAVGAVSGPLIGATVQAAAQFAAGGPVAGLVSSTTWMLTQEVLQAMLIAKLKSAAVVLLLIGVVGLGAGALLNSTIAGTQTPLAGAGGQPAPAEGARPARPEDEGKFTEPLGLRGAIHAIDGSKNPVSVTINVGEDGKVQLSLDLARDAKVFVAGQPAALADLKPEAEVVLVLGTDKRTVAQVEARGRMIEGKLLRVDVAAGTLTVQDDDENNQTQTVALGKDAAIYIDGYRGRLADLEDCKDGELELELAADEKSVARILAAWKQEGDPEGEITQIDAAAGVVTVRVEEDDDQVNDFKVKATAESRLFVNGQPAKLADLQVGWKATLRGNGDVVKAMRVVKRAAKAVDEDDD